MTDFLIELVYHKQHIRAASCRSRLESQWETPNFDTRGAIELKIGRINYHGGLTKGAKFQICNALGGRLALLVQYRLLGAF